MSITQPEILISIVSASWNQGAYVEECILSIDKKFHHLVEHIVIDNCSDDSTHSVLEQYDHLKVVIESDKGQSEALNKGFRAAKGQWVLWLNIDDYLLPGALERYLNFVKKSSNYDLIYGHTVFVNNEGEKIRTIYQPKWYYFMTKMGCYVAPSTGSLYRTEVLIDNPLDEDFHMIMDSEWMLRVGKGLKVHRIQSEMMAFRISGENKTAAHITTGELTPRHLLERKLLSKAYPYYASIGEDDKGRFHHFKLAIVRKIIRYCILFDKGCSKFKTGWK